MKKKFTCSHIRSWWIQSINPVTLEMWDSELQAKYEQQEFKQVYLLCKIIGISYVVWSLVKLIRSAEEINFAYFIQALLMCLMILVLLLAMRFL